MTSIAPNAAPAVFTLFWLSADKTGEFNMGDFGSKESAEAALPEARAILLDACADEAEIAGIMSGTWHVIY